LLKKIVAAKFLQIHTKNIVILLTGIKFFKCCKKNLKTKQNTLF